MSAPTVTVAVPTYQEERHIGACLDAIADQTYPNIIEVLVVDGGSTDATRAIVQRRTGVRLLDNPKRVQAAALNIALAAARGEIFVRVDAHCVIEPDYVERCVALLEETGAAMVGGRMTPVAHGWMQRGIAAALCSPLGAGTARFHVGGPPGWVDTVYLGAYRTATARRVGGYSEDVGVNEDAELAIRLRIFGGIWFDPSIRSHYVPRSTVRAVARQFYRYGVSRAATVRKHPKSLAARQLVCPSLLLSLLTPWRPVMIGMYVLAITSAAIREAIRSRSLHVGLAFALAACTMHVTWGLGFLRGIMPHQRTLPPIRWMRRRSRIGSVARHVGVMSPSRHAASHGRTPPE